MNNTGYNRIMTDSQGQSEEYYKWGKKRATKVISFYKLRILQEPNEGFTHEKSEC